MKNQLHIMFATVSTVISFCLIPYTGLRVHMFLPGVEQGLQPVLAGALITGLLITPWCYGRGMTYSRLLNGCLAAQISGALFIALQQFQFEPDYLWPLTISAFILGLDYPQLHKMLTFTNFNLFRCSLSAGTALINVYAQTLLALTVVNNYPYLLLIASINTIIVGLNLKHILNQNPLNGATIIEHYLTFWEKIKSGPLNKRSLLIRLLLIGLSCVTFNPLLAYATQESCPEIWIGPDLNDSNYESFDNCKSSLGTTVAEGAATSSIGQRAFDGASQVLKPMQKDIIAGSAALFTAAALSKVGEVMVNTTIDVAQNASEKLVDAITTCDPNNVRNSLIEDPFGTIVNPTEHVDLPKQIDLPKPKQIDSDLNNVLSKNDFSLKQRLKDHGFGKSILKDEFLHLHNKPDVKVVIINNEFDNFDQPLSVRLLTK